MLNLFYIIIAIELFTIFYNLFKFFIYKIRSKHNYETLNYAGNNDFHICVLIPCYREIKVIKKTLEHFKKIMADMENIDFYVITTEKEKVELVKKIKQCNYPKIIQQYSNYFLNYDFQNFIMRGFSIYQTAFEFRNGIINNNISNLLYSHVLGHGLTLRADYIISIGGFTSKFWCEDIYLTGLIHNNLVFYADFYTLYIYISYNNTKL